MEELRPLVGAEVSVTIDGPVDAALSDEIVEHLLATLREALTNVSRHSRASRASVMLGVDTEMCRLQILDNGQGIDADASKPGGRGLVNMRRRAEKLHGTFEVETPESGGALLVWQVPLRQ